MSLAHAYRYAEPSSLEALPRPTLMLATSGGPAPHPHFFEGRALFPRLTADLPTTVHQVVGARFFTPPRQLARIVALADPVVTASGGVLRFEGFSSCCSTYARADLLPESYQGDFHGQGTTNVDFGAAMRAALSRVRDATGLGLCIGRRDFVLSSGLEQVIERQVELPQRWIRGLLEVQSYLSSMQLRFAMNRVAALHFLRSLPKASTARTPLWAASGPGGVFTSTRPLASGVRIADARRLIFLEVLAPRAESVTVYADEAQQSSAWVLDFGKARLTLALSAEVWRGFSGEGQALRALLHAGEAEALLPALRSRLAWQSAIDVPALAAELGCQPVAIAGGLQILGLSGLVGFDVSAGAYFHRMLPLDLANAEELHPRLRGARELLEAGAVEVQEGSPFRAVVRSGAASHTVRASDGGLRCTCPFFAKHRGERGPCKHVLAAEVVRHRQELPE